MLPSLGYVEELTEAGEQGGRETRSEVSPDESTVEGVAAEAVRGAESVTLRDDPVSGGDGVSYVFTTAAGESYVLKAVPDDAAARLRKGTAVYDRFEAVAGVPVPEVYAVETDDTALAYPFSVVGYVPGDELTSITQFRDFSRSEKRGLVRTMGRVLGRVHTTTGFNAYGSLAVDADGELVVHDGTPEWTAHYGERYESAAEQTVDSPVEGLAAEAAEFFKARAGECNPDHGPVLLHGDFTPDNLIIDGGEIRAVLDWEHAAAGCRVKEFWEVEENVANIFGSAEVRSALREALLAGYRETAPVSEAFLALKQLFAVGVFSRIGGAHAAVAGVVEAFDSDEFQRRAEAELEDRIARADSQLQRL